jgi:transaldolase
MTDPLTALTEAGVSIWLDDLSRDRLTSGSLADLVARDHVAGVTTNPAIFAKAIAAGLAEAISINVTLVADHGQVPANSIHDRYDQSQEVLDGLRELGIDYDDVVQSLEKDGVAKFDASWDQLGERLVSALRHQSASR